MRKTMRKPIRERIVRPIVEFLHLETSGGIALIAASLAALLLANSPARDAYASWLHTPLTFALGRDALTQDLHFWVNDGLMAIFFLLVGLEIKREVVAGELASARAAALPIAAAVGGMALPAVLYYAVNRGGPGAPGWGISMATDIAFSLGVLALLGPRVPLALKVFLAALAIVDDLGAVLVIALFYSSQIHGEALLASGGILAVLLLFNLMGVRALWPYLLLGVPLWACVFASGIHATLAGVLLALTIPARTRVRPHDFAERVRSALVGFDKPGVGAALSGEQIGAVNEIERACQHVQMPLERIENALHPWVTFFIVPLFAFANAGIAVDASAFSRLGEPIGIGIALGLILGKPLGIVGFSYLAVRLGAAELPAGVGWRQIVGVGVLGGIGFTMSLFIADLAFGKSSNLEAAKFAILLASLVAGTTGYFLLKQAPRSRVNA